MPCAAISTDGTVLKVEKNHVVEIVPSSWNQSADTEELELRAPDENLGTLIANGERSVGAEKFWIYDARTQNCQFFMKWLLQNTRAWSRDAEKFVMQNTAQVLEGIGFLGKS